MLLKSLSALFLLLSHVNTLGKLSRCCHGNSWNCRFSFPSLVFPSGSSEAGTEAKISRRSKVSWPLRLTAPWPTTSPLNGPAGGRPSDIKPGQHADSPEHHRSQYLILFVLQRRCRSAASSPKCLSFGRCDCLCGRRWWISVKTQLNYTPLTFQSVL